jgi:hypothetical protein
MHVDTHTFFQALVPLRWLESPGHPALLANISCCTGYICWAVVHSPEAMSNLLHSPLSHSEQVVLPPSCWQRKIEGTERECAWISSLSVMSGQFSWVFISLTLGPIQQRQRHLSLCHICSLCPAAHLLKAVSTTMVSLPYLLSDLLQSWFSPSSTLHWNYSSSRPLTTCLRLKPVDTSQLLCSSPHEAIPICHVPGLWSSLPLVVYVQC